MALKKLRDFLDLNSVKYTLISHSPAYTAQEIAHKAHVPGKELGKTVMVKIDGKLAMAVIPATERVDLELLALNLGASEATIAHEGEFEDVFPGCERGAMPPFGNLWRIPVYVSTTLAEDTMITFNAGSHVEVMTLPFRDFRRLVEPRILPFSQKQKQAPRSQVAHN